MSQRIYAIGDIHGQHELLLDALALIEMDSGADARVVVLGDLVDRGAGSRNVIDTLMRGIAEGRQWTVLKGNHDAMFLHYLAVGSVRHARLRPGLDWLMERLGGMETLASYGVDTALTGEALVDAARAAVPEAHVQFLTNLPLKYETDDLYFVHAGIQPRLPLEWQSEDDMLWIRDEFLNFEEPMPKLIVHGHTSVDEPEHKGNRINLDSGAGYGRALTTAVFEEGRVFVLEEDGRRALTPA